MCELRILSKILGTEKQKNVILRPTCKNGLIHLIKLEDICKFWQTLSERFYAPRNKRTRLCETLHFSFFQETGENFISVLSPS